VTLVARTVGEEDFVRFLVALRRLGVIDRTEKVRWLALHGAVIRAIEPPLEDDSGFDEAAFAALAEECEA
jgi:hypothetical protein